ncbi:thiol-disulfide oxidoreductase DCC family protein [Serinicoccus chungangensis]|uniref:thiol-disulfide oxidoreductase DCC family protein n=1 Tax=Serinicoccus chungangensis TaxID=767452 RepID=UPI001119C894|nr:DCC1-like thiol-disulfide oxidoreductase family protein [Serinicoccus chungangensis]
MTTASRPRPLALYDGDCGFCTMAAGWIPRLGARVDVSSLQEHDLAALGVDEARTGLEMPVVLPDGRVAYGHRAWAQILAHCPQPLRTLGLVLGSRVMERPGAAVYRLVAANRSHLPGGTAQCALPQQPTGGATDSPATSAGPGQG